MKTPKVSKVLVTLAALTVLVCSAGRVTGQEQPATATPEAAPQAAEPAVPLPPDAEDILKLSRAKVHEDVIVAFILNSGRKFKLTAAEVIELRKQGVSERVLTTMLQPSSPAVAPPPPAPAPEPVPTVTPPPSPTPAPQYATVQTTEPPVYVAPDAPPSYYYDYPYYASSSYYPYYYPYYPYYPYYCGYPYYGYPYWGFSIGFGFGCGYYGYYGHGHHHHDGIYVVGQNPNKGANGGARVNGYQNGITRPAGQGATLVNGGKNSSYYRGGTAAGATPASLTGIARPGVASATRPGVAGARSGVAAARPTGGTVTRPSTAAGVSRPTYSVPSGVSRPTYGGSASVSRPGFSGASRPSGFSGVSRPSYSGPSSSGMSRGGGFSGGMSRGGGGGGGFSGGGGGFSGGMARGGGGGFSGGRR